MLQPVLPIVKHRERYGFETASRCNPSATEMTPDLVLTPVFSAEAVPAESGVCRGILIFSTAIQPPYSLLTIRHEERGGLQVRVTMKAFPLA
jgi:hypothetical protein